MKADPTPHYAGFLVRSAALGMDAALFLPAAMALGELELYRDSIAGYLVFFGAIQATWLAYHVVMHGIWGQSLGKMAFRVQVTACNGQPINFRQALLRSIVNILFTGASFALAAWTILSISQAELSQLDTQAFYSAIYSRQPTTATLVNLASYVWMGAEAISLLVTKNNRTLHDFIAGTVVIRPRTTETPAR